MAVTGAPHGLGEDVHLECLLAAVGLRHAGDAHIGALLDVCQRRLAQRNDPRISRKLDLQLGPTAGLDDIDVAFDAVDGSPHAHGRLLSGCHGHG